jgi:Ca-activated chloride channel family protein
MSVFIVLGLLVAIITVVFLWGTRQRPQASTPAARRKSSSGGRPRTTSRSFGRSPRWLRRLPVLLIVLAAASLAVALSQFRLTKAKTQETPIVMLVIDASQTMDRRDIKPDRLTAARAAAQSLLDQLPENFRVGLVTYATEPAVLVSPTFDQSQVATELASPPPG